MRFAACAPERAATSTRPANRPRLIAAIRTVQQGRKYVTPEVAQMLVDNLSAPENEELHASLSERETADTAKNCLGSQALRDRR